VHDVDDDEVRAGRIAKPQLRLQDPQERWPIQEPRHRIRRREPSDAAVRGPRVAQEPAHERERDRREDHRAQVLPADVADLHVLEGLDRADDDAGDQYRRQRERPGRDDDGSEDEHADCGAGKLIERIERQHECRHRGGQGDVRRVTSKDRCHTVRLRPPTRARNGCVQ